MIGAGGDGPEHPDIATTGFSDQAAYVGTMASKRSGAWTGAVEVQEPGHLWLAATDLLSDFGLGHSFGSRGTDGAYQLGACLGHGPI